MIDIHSHVIYGVDDGPSTIEESLRMVYEAEETGVRTIIATPHLNEYLFMDDRVFGNYRTLLSRLGDSQVEIKLGFEVLLNPFIPQIVRERKMLTLNNSGFMLLEFPFSIVPPYSHETVYKLQLDNITPVIAHPERNRDFVRNISLLEEFIDRGCLLQVDSPSIMGIYGERAKSFSKRLICSGMANFVASDAHCRGHYSNWHLKAYLKVVEWVGRESADRLFGKNANQILDKKEINACKVV